MARLKPLLRKVAASVADQAVLSGTNFTVNVLLARWLSPDDYGAFAIAWSVALILTAVHNALILEPMSVVGPSEFATHLGSYLKLAGKLNWTAIVSLGMLAATSAVFYHDLRVRDALSVLGLSLPGYLLLLTARRELYVLDRPALALRFSLLYSATFGPLVWLLKRLGELSSWTAVAALGISLLAAFWALSKRDLPRDFQPSHDSLANVWSKHWRYGKWLLAAALLGVGASDLQILLLSKMVSIESSGVLRALMNFVLPLGQLLTVLSVFSLPKLARIVKLNGVAVGLRQAGAYALFIVLLVLAYLGALLALARPLEQILYGGRMAPYVVYLPLLAVGTFLSSFAAAFTTPLRAAHNSFHTLTAGIAATVAGLIAATFLLPRYGLRGALLSLIVANAATALIVVGTYIWLLARTPVRWNANDRALVVFDENLIRTSPVGSCLLRVVEHSAKRFPLHIYYNRLDPGMAGTCEQSRIPLPAGPVVLRSVLFTFLSGLACFFEMGSRPALRIAAQGVFPFCDISYAQFCHRIFLRDHRDAIGGGFFRRIARYMIHIWGALTERKAFRRARTIVVPSEGLARELRSAYPQLVTGKIVAIPNPVDIAGYERPPDFARERLREGLGCGAGDLLLCFCALGNFERKGLRFAIDAVAELHDPRVRLVVVGGSVGEIHQYESLCSAAGIAGQVRFTGLQEDVRPYLWSSDAFLFPSLYEAFPLVSLQAAAAGLPLIVTAINGVEEFMMDSVTGWIVEPNAKSIALVIAQALASPTRLTAMGRAARERVQHYGEPQFIARWQTLLQAMWSEV